MYCKPVKCSIVYFKNNEQVINYLRRELSNTLGRVINCLVRDFRQGSVVADLEFALGATSEANADSLVQEAVALTGEGDLTLQFGDDILTTSSISVTGEFFH